MSGFDADRRLVPRTLLVAARSVVDGNGDLALAIQALTKALSEAEALSPPILAVVVKRGRVQSISSNRPDVLAPMLYEALVIDLDGFDGPLVDTFSGRARMASVTSEEIRQSDFDLNALVEEYWQSISAKKRP